MRVASPSAFAQIITMKLLPQSVRRRPRTFALLLLFNFALILHNMLPLLRLLSEDGSLNSISSMELISNPQISEKRLLIPKIIHQTYKNWSIPLKWQKSQNRTRTSHEDYEYKVRFPLFFESLQIPGFSECCPIFNFILDTYTVSNVRSFWLTQPPQFWTDDSALAFIETHYPEYLSIYTSYPYPIQRADAIRYFVLYYYGGIYLDLDVTTYRHLDPLLTLPAFACLTTPTGISNDALGSSPHHPFFQHVINSLANSNSNWGSPYVTIMASTGPLFLSLRWKEWLDRGEGDFSKSIVALRRDEREYGYRGFFIDIEGRSWQGPDERYIAWLERHWALDMILGSLGVICVTWVLWETFWCVRKRAHVAGRLGVRMRRWDIEHGWSNGEKIR
jgi:mannosyltransferase OCH1-like enzyme